MDLANINLSEYNFIAPTNIEKITLDNPEKFIDINIQDDHSFFIYMSNNDTYILSHNCDGSHIAGLYIGFFFKYCKSIIEQGLLKRLRTPIIVFKDKNEKIKYFFFTLDEYNKFIKTHDLSRIEDTLL